MKISDIINEGDYTTSMDYLGSLGDRSPHRGDPVMSPDLGGGTGPGGAGKLVRIPKVWRRSETPAQQQAQQFLQGQGFKKEPTPQEKLTTAAQSHASTTGEPVVTLKPGSLASRMLDKFFPEPKQRIEPTMGTDPATMNMGRKEPKMDEDKEQLDFDKYLQDPNVQKMLNLIGKAEGADYDTIVGGKQRIKDFSAHPNIVGLRTKQGPSTAAGKYQITNTTYKNYADKMGIRDFSPSSQDKIAVQILHDIGALKDVTKGKFKDAINKAGGTWVSLPSSKIAQGRGPRSWDWISKNLKDTGTDVLAALTGSGTAQASEIPPKKIKEPPRVVPNVPEPDSTTMSRADVKKMPPVDLFGHIFPSVDWNKQGGIAGISTKPYTLPDGTVVTDKRELGKIRSVQKVPGTKTYSGSITKADVVPQQDKPAEPEIKAPPKSSVRQEFEKEFAKQRAAQGAGGTFDWTNPATGKTSKFTTDYAAEPKSKVAESVNTELTDILRLAGKN